MSEVDSQPRPLPEDAKNAALRLAREALRHEVPENCWATGPRTGNLCEDLVVCPGCRAIDAIEEALKETK